MSVVIGTLALNEMQWLPKLYEQHKNWPSLAKWVFVESADTVYAATNPELVSSDGLSVDGTTEFLEELTRKDDRVVHVKHGISKASNPAQGKCESRQRYLDIAEKVNPDMLMVVDADEFYSYEHQESINSTFQQSKNFTAIVFKHRDIWHPEILADQPVFRYEVTGGFWDIPYCRCWRWSAGIRYQQNHNTPQSRRGALLDKRLQRLDRVEGTPYCVHMAFASALKNRAAKHKYYVARGEGRTDHRQWYVDSRMAFEVWKPGTVLPRGAQVVPYTGVIPEVFRNGD